ncbi:MAG: hypothetical protein ACI8Z5_002675 [Lentimonas sp.]|jgi:hypothetical protein
MVRPLAKFDLSSFATPSQADDLPRLCLYALGVLERSLPRARSVLRDGWFKLWVLACASIRSVPPTTKKRKRHECRFYTGKR